MSLEWLRVHSFRNYVGEGSAHRLAQNGFYHVTGSNTATRCYCCNTHVKDWNYFDNIETRHRRHMPNCHLLQGGYDVTNIPICSGATPETATCSTPLPFVEENVNTSDPTERHRHGEVSSSEGNRSQSEDPYAGLPANVIRQREDVVRKKDTLVDVTAYQLADRIEAHKVVRSTYQPTQDVRNQQTPVLAASSSSFTPQQQTQCASASHHASVATPPSFIGAEQARSRCRTIKNPDHAKMSARISSFQGWPSDLDISPSQMAEAGLYYTGSGDMVRCFCCNYGFRHWEPGDDPLLEHIHWNPTCEYILNLKGEPFVREVSAQYQAGGEQNHRCQEPGTRYVMHGSRSEVYPGQQGETETSLIEMGYTVARVRDIVLKLRRRTGNMDVTAEEVLNLILEEEDQGIAQPPPGRPANISVVQTRHTITSARTEAAVHKTTANVRQGTGQNPQSEPSRTANQTASGSTVANSNSSQRDFKTGTSSKKPQMRRDSGAALNSPETNQSSSSKSLDPESLREENKKLTEMQLCKVCLDSPVAVTFLPCGHLVCCEKCSKLLKHCPICRKRVKGTIKTYMS